MKKKDSADFTRKFLNSLYLQDLIKYLIEEIEKPDIIDFDIKLLDEFDQDSEE